MNDRLSGCYMHDGWTVKRRGRGRDYHTTHTPPPPLILFLLSPFSYSPSHALILPPLPSLFPSCFPLFLIPHSLFFFFLSLLFLASLYSSFLLILFLSLLSSLFTFSPLPVTLTLTPPPPLLSLLPPPSPPLF